MGTQGATGLQEIFLGSTTNGVIKKTKTKSNLTYLPIWATYFKYTVFMRKQNLV